MRSTVTGFQEVGGGDVDITEAEVLVSVGRDIEEEENIELVKALAETLDATLFLVAAPSSTTVGCPRTDRSARAARWLTPEAYIAIGISGAVQHGVGMKDEGRGHRRRHQHRFKRTYL